jgi:serine/threonine-protein kinase
LEPAPGTVVATRYRILRPLGKGGMGEVWAAENVRTGRQVAVKLLRSESKAKSSAIERFRREARAAGSINSDHVTQVLDIDEDPEHGIAIVFELLEGESLIERLKRTGPMSFEELHPVIEQVWLGLADAHRAGIIHRDLKPSNVFLERRPDGVVRVKILDFGISKLPKELTGDTLTEMGQSLGTFSFMPPEQIGKAKTVDHRADIYATTTLIYQALSGQLPYEARNILLMVELKSKQEPRTLAAAMDGPVDAALEAFLAKGLAREPAQRFQSAGEALTAWRDLAPTAAQSRPTQQSSWTGPAVEPAPPSPSAAANAKAWATTAPVIATPATPPQPQRQPTHAGGSHLGSTAALGTRPTRIEAPPSPRVAEPPAEAPLRDITTAPSVAGPPVALVDPDTSDGIATIAIPYGGRLHRGPSPAAGDRPSHEPATVPRPVTQQAPLAAASPQIPVAVVDPPSQRAGNGTLVMEYDARTGLAGPAYAKTPNRPLASPPSYPQPGPADAARQQQQYYEEQARQQAMAAYGAPQPPPYAPPDARRPPASRSVAPLVLGAIVFALVGFGLVALALRFFNL